MKSPWEFKKKKREIVNKFVTNYTKTKKKNLEIIKLIVKYEKFESDSEINGWKKGCFHHSSKMHLVERSILCFIYFTPISFGILLEPIL